MTLFDFVAQPVFQKTGWALLHSVWQGMLIVALYGLAVQCFGRKSQTRYLFGLIALAAMIGSLPITYALLPNSIIEPTTVTASPAIAPVAPIDELPIANTPLEQFIISETTADFEPAAVAPFNDDSNNLPAASVSDVRTSISAWPAVLVGLISLLWSLGVTLGSIRLLCGAIGLRSLNASGVSLGTEWRSRLERLTELSGLRVVPRLIGSSSVQQAFVAGFFRPVIVLPVAWLTELTPSMVEAILAHELAHIRRWDLWVNLLQRAAEAILFFHPAVWWLSNQVRLDREMCCDELAIEITHRRLDYVTALEAIARRAAGAPRFGLATGVGGKKMAILDRVRNVLGQRPSARQGTWWPSAMLALAVPVGLWALSAGIDGRAVADDDAPSKSSSSKKDGDRPEKSDRDKNKNERNGDNNDRDKNNRDDDDDHGDKPSEGRRPDRRMEVEIRRFEGRGPDRRPLPPPRRDGEDRLRSAGERGDDDRREAGRDERGPKEVLIPRDVLIRQSRDDADDRRGPPEGGPMRVRLPAPGAESSIEMMRLMHELREEVSMLRREVRELRGQRGSEARGPEGRPGDRERRDGDEGPPRREGAARDGQRGSNASPFERRGPDRREGEAGRRPDVRRGPPEREERKDDEKKRDGDQGKPREDSRGDAGTATVDRVAEFRLPAIEIELNTLGKLEALLSRTPLEDTKSATEK